VGASYALDSAKFDDSVNQVQSRLAVARSKGGAVATASDGGPAGDSTSDDSTVQQEKNGLLEDTE
jgi:hypothetical protein